MRPVESRGGAIELVGLSKFYGAHQVLRDIDLDVASGEFFSLLGPSGCGKTTTLRLIGGFEHADAGQVLLDGVDLSDVPPERRPVNTVFQSYALFPHLTVEQNVAFGLRFADVDQRDVPRRVGEALELVQMTTLASRKPHRLSGGQQQRVALARALVLRPRVLLLDEPLGALDAQLRKALQLELSGLQRDIGITFVYVTHDQEEALTMSDRIAVMNHGEVSQVGSPRDVYERPESSYVAAFLGVANLVPVEHRGGGTVAIDGLDSAVLRAADGNAEVGACHIVVRPERIRLSPPGAGARTDDEINVIAATITKLVYMGPTTQVHLDGGPVQLQALIPNDGTALCGAVGDRVDVELPPDAVRLVAA
jgi:spermidine/putrescine transport system ATP-binding protein